MESVIQTVQEMAKTADEAGRKKIISALNNLSMSLEKPQDLMLRLLYLVCAFESHRLSTETIFI